LSPGMSSHERYVNDFCQQQKMDCLFLRPRFRREVANGAKLESRHHWTPEMHRMAAEEIDKFLVEKRLVQSTPSAAAPN
jgi:hypothetical protein